MGTSVDVQGVLPLPLALIDFYTAHCFTALELDLYRSFSESLRGSEFHPLSAHAMQGQDRLQFFRFYRDGFARSLYRYPDGTGVDHPLLEGILLSECFCLKQRLLSNKLTNLFQQFRGTEIRLKRVWLCWYYLMLSAPLTDWIENLKFKTEEALNRRVNALQDENWALAV